MNRRKLLLGLASLPTFSLLTVHAQDAFPSKPIRIIVATAPGGITDYATRIYAGRMPAFLKQPVVIENVAGAGSLLAARLVAKAAPDGYTLLTVANTIVTLPHLNARADYTMKDFTAVGELVRSPSMLVVSASSPFRSLDDLVAAAKKQPGSVTFGSGGIGTTNHLPAELFMRKADVKFTHVPYRGTALAMPDVTSGRVNFMMGAPTSYAQLLKSGALRALGITSEERSPKYPSVATFKELGFADATFEIWIGMLAPAGTPAPVVAHLAAALQAARDAELIAKLDAAGQHVSNVRTPAQFDAVLRYDGERLRKLIVEAGITVE